MLQLICHLFGDYVLQNHWMAANKVRRWFPAIVHAFVYSLVFVACIQPSPAALSVIFGTHVIIDRFRLARYWVEWFGVGEPGRLWMDKYACVGMKQSYDRQSAPPHISAWLLIIVDNSFHLAINFAALRYL